MAIFPADHSIALLVPDFLLRRLYKKGSLRETGDGRFAFTLQNPLRVATILAPPEIVVNGVHHKPHNVAVGDGTLATISASNPYVFRKGDETELRFHGHLLRGGNVIHMTVSTKEFGDVEVYVEDREAIFCDLPVAKQDAAKASA